MKEIEIRTFAWLRDHCTQRGWPFPYHYALDKPCTALELAQRLELPGDKIEAVFINYKIFPLEEGYIHPGDRVGFVPYGTPGACRLLLGIKHEHQKE